MLRRATRNPRLAGFEVESSRDSEGLAARPLGFNLGTPNGPGSVPPGLDECIRGMQVVSSAPDA